MKPLIYVAGPLSLGWLPDNIRNAIDVGNKLYEMGAIPFVPHAQGVMWEMMIPREYDFYMNIGIGVLNRSDALVRISGESKGSDREVLIAQDNSIPVFKLCQEDAWDDIVRWINQWYWNSREESKRLKSQSKQN